MTWFIYVSPVVAGSGPRSPDLFAIQDFPLPFALGCRLWICPGDPRGQMSPTACVRRRKRANNTKSDKARKLPLFPCAPDRAPRYPSSWLVSPAGRNTKAAVIRAPCPRGSPAELPAASVPLDPEAGITSTR